MTELLQQAVSEIEKLSAEQQDSIASRILAELADEEAWQAQFKATTDEQWDRLADSARREIAAGAVYALDEILQPRNRQS